MTRYRPIYICASCELRLYLHQVDKVEQDFKESLTTNLKNCIKDIEIEINKVEYLETKVERQQYICKKCKTSLRGRRMPKLCTQNGLKVDSVPEEIKLTELEANLIAKNIIFQKLHKKPKSRMAGCHDRLINVPINKEDIDKTLKNYPIHQQKQELLLCP